MRHLLDVNVWVALLDEAHVFHARALSFIQQPALALATCPLVENGVIRVLNLPGYSKYGAPGLQAVQLKLRQICSDLNAEFWSDSISLRDSQTVNWPRVMGHNQITDVYLLALCVANGGCLVTLDHRVTLSTVLGATGRNLQLL